MRRIDPLQQTTFIDPFDFLGPKRKELLENGWSGLFRKTLLEQIPVEEIKTRFHAQMGRPSKELRRMLGFILLFAAANLI
ncbi:hypothetical protein GF373_05050 [bacterium]|nr:hypothetical protein [bacterium]